MTQSKGNTMEKIQSFQQMVLEQVDTHARKNKQTKKNKTQNRIQTQTFHLTTWFLKMGQNLNRHLTKEDIQTLNKYMNYVKHHMPSGKCKLKQWDSTAHLLKWWNSKTLTSTKCWRGCRAIGTLIHWWWECKMVTPFWKTVWQFLIKWASFYYTIQQSHSLVFTQMNWKLISTQ